MRNDAHSVTKSGHMKRATFEEIAKRESAGIDKSCKILGARKNFQELHIRVNENRDFFTLTIQSDTKILIMLSTI